MLSKAWLKRVALGGCVMLAGCATSRSEIALHSPTVVAPAATAASNQHVVVFGAITDERTFEQAPSDPSTPSLGFGGADHATADIKARAIGRKRNSYGKALGDVTLQPGHTVQSEIKENLTVAFEQAGYQVKDQANAGASALVVDVHIKQFWSWFTPGFFAVTLSSNISTDLLFNGAPAPIVVSTHVEDKHAAATESDWIEITEKGLDAYRAKVVQAMQGSRFAQLVAANPNASAVAVTVAPTSAAEPAPAATPDAVAPVAAASLTAAPTSSASSVNTSAAQEVATGMGCGVVADNGNSTFIAPCGAYSVLIDCDGDQCRPMHTVNVKKED